MNTIVEGSTNGIANPEKVSKRKALRVTPLATGNGLRVQTDLPHLVSLGGGRLSTAVTLLPIPHGRTLIGSDQSAGSVGIVISGCGVEPQHCCIVNDEDIVTLHPIAPLITVDGRKVTGPTRLQQGAMLCFGRSHYFRFNHPTEALRMKAKFPAIAENSQPYNHYTNGTVDHELSTEEEENSAQHLYDNVQSVQATRRSRRDAYLENQKDYHLDPPENISQNQWDTNLVVRNPPAIVPSPVQRMNSNSQSMVSLSSGPDSSSIYSVINRKPAHNSIDRHIAQLENSGGLSAQEVMSAILARNALRHSLNSPEYYSTNSSNSDYWGGYDNIADLKNSLKAVQDTLDRSPSAGHSPSNHPLNISEDQDYRNLTHDQNSRTMAHGLGSNKASSQMSDLVSDGHRFTDAAPISPRSEKSVADRKFFENSLLLNQTESSPAVPTKSTAEMPSCSGMESTEDESITTVSTPDVDLTDSDFRSADNVDSSNTVVFIVERSVNLNRVNSTASENSICKETERLGKKSSKVKEKPPVCKQTKEKKSDKKKKERVNVKSEIKDNKGDSGSKGSFFRSLLNRSRSPSPSKGVKRSESPSLSKDSEVARRLSEPLKSSFRLVGYEDKPRLVPNQSVLEEGNEEVEISDSTHSSIATSSTLDSTETLTTPSADNIQENSDRVSISKVVHDENNSTWEETSKTNSVTTNDVSGISGTNISYVRDSNGDTSTAAILSSQIGSSMTLPTPKPRNISSQSSCHSVASNHDNPWCVNLKELKINPNLDNYKGEKLFTKDTVTTTVIVPGIDMNILSAASKRTPSTTCLTASVPDEPDSPLYDSVYEGRSSPKDTENSQSQAEKFTFDCKVSEKFTFDCETSEKNTFDCKTSDSFEDAHSVNRIFPPRDKWKEIDDDLNKVQEFLNNKSNSGVNHEGPLDNGSQKYSDDSCADTAERKTKLRRDLDKQQMNVLEALRNKHLLTISAESRLNRLLTENQNSWTQQDDSSSTLTRSGRKSGKSVKFKDEVSEDDSSNSETHDQEDRLKNCKLNENEFPFPVNEEELREALRRCNISNVANLDNERLALTKSASLPTYGKASPLTVGFNCFQNGMKTSILSEVLTESEPCLNESRKDLQNLYESTKAQRLLEEESAKSEMRRFDEIKKLWEQYDTDSSLGNAIQAANGKKLNEKGARIENGFHEIPADAKNMGAEKSTHSENTELTALAIYTAPKAGLSEGSSEERAVMLLTRRQSIMRRIASLKDQISEVALQQKHLIQQLTRQNAAQPQPRHNHALWSNLSLQKELRFANEIHELVQERNLLEIECRQANAEMVAVDEILQSLTAAQRNEIVKESVIESLDPTNNWFNSLDTRHTVERSNNFDAIGAGDSQRNEAKATVRECQMLEPAAGLGIPKQPMVDAEHLIENSVTFGSSYSKPVGLQQKPDSNPEAFYKDKQNNLEVSQNISKQQAHENQEQLRLEEQLNKEVSPEMEDISKQKPHPDKSSLRRPLTRYMPLIDTTIDLKTFIESCGHKLDQCPLVQLTSTQCRGHLLKLSQSSSAMRKWLKRWFVFDRSKRCLYYYADSKSELKPHKSIYFQSIQDVFVDHLQSVKSPNPGLTFCVKTLDRNYFLMAQSSEVMRIWIDVIFTGAEAHQQFL